MYNKILLVAVFLTAIGVHHPVANGDLISTFDFNDGNWDVQVTTFDGGVDDGSGVVSNTSLFADRDSGTGGVLVTATLTGTISTVGFNDVTLSFTNTNTAGNLEYFGTTVFGSNGDGFSIQSSQGISFDTTGASSGFEILLDAGTAWNTTNASGQSQDLQFASSVNNSSVSNLTIQLQVDAESEAHTLSAFSLNGTAVPEPSSFLFLGVVGCVVTIYSSRLFLKRGAAKACGFFVR